MTVTFTPKLYTSAFAALLLLILNLLTGCENKEQAQGGGGFPPPAVSVAEVVVGTTKPWEEFTGRIEAKEVVQIRPRVGGVIEQIKYREGDIVKKGDLLFVLDQHPFRAELNRAEAELARARAQAEFAELDSRRAKNLIKKNLLSQDEYDQRIAAENQASANVRSAEATVRLARLNLEYTEIRAPITGRTGRALVTKGNLVASDPTPDLLTTILSLDPVFVEFDCDELTFLKYFANPQSSSGNDRQQKRTVFVGLGNEQGFPREGYVDFVDNRVTPETGTIHLRAVLENKNYQLTPGLFARVKLLGTQPEQVILVDDHAILTDQDRKYVYVLGNESQAVRRNVVIGRLVNGFRSVSSGLNPGDKLIVHGIQKIFFPNMPVAPQTISMGDPPPPPPGAMPGSMPAAEPATETTAEPGAEKNQGNNPGNNKDKKES